MVLPQPISASPPSNVCLFCCTTMFPNLRNSTSVFRSDFGFRGVGFVCAGYLFSFLGSLRYRRVKQIPARSRKHPTEYVLQHLSQHVSFMTQLSLNNHS